MSSTITITGTKAENFDAKQMREVLHALGVEDPTIVEDSEQGTELTDDQLVLIMTKFPATITQFDPDVVDRVRDRLPQEVAA